MTEWLSLHSVPQYHIAETEKYAHVTFFFNGGTEAQFSLEDRKLVPSPKISTYDLKPEMSMYEVAEEVCQGIASHHYPFIMCNLAPPDMVGHTGVFKATVEAIEATDRAIGKIWEACRSHNYILAITADHGNAEKMIDEKGGPHTAHTTSPVPFVLGSTLFRFRESLSSIDANKTSGALCDVAPTLLEMMGLPIPQEMTGRSLLMKNLSR
jgi:2,3-bisphosphoglycerate-independent phosphoglycerate mutase